MLAQWHLGGGGAAVDDKKTIKTDAKAPAASSSSSGNGKEPAVPPAATPTPSSVGRDVKEAREVYKAGLKAAPTAVDLWLCCARLEIEEKQWAKARAVLETARLKVPKHPTIWLEAIRVEHLAKNEKVA